VYIKLIFLAVLLVALLAVMLNPNLLYRMGLPREKPPATQPNPSDVPGRTVRIIPRSMPATRPGTPRDIRDPDVEVPHASTLPATQPVRLPLGIDPAILNDVEDLQPIEKGPYFEALKAVRAMPETAFTQPGLPTVTLADLLQDPVRFRGRLVTIRGNLRRLERQALGPNAAGLTHVHEGQIRHGRSGFYTFVVIDDPPTGIQVGRSVAVAGVFFKVWVYRDRRGTLRQTPLLMGRRLRLLESQYPEQPRIPIVLGTAVGLLLVLLMVLAVVLYRRGDRKFYRRFRVPGGEVPVGLEPAEPTGEPASAGDRDAAEAETGGEEPGNGNHQP